MKKHEAINEIENDIMSGYIDCYLTHDEAMFWLSQILNAAFKGHETGTSNQKIAIDRVNAVYQTINTLISHQIDEHLTDVMTWGRDDIVKERGMYLSGH